jgi:hypothetical protein
MSRHSKPIDDPTPGSKGGKPAAAQSASVQKAGSPTGKPARSVAPKEEASWTEVANFVVTFERRESETGAGIERRITAHKMQDDGITAKWTGVAQQPMCEWIADHVSDWVIAEPRSAEVDGSAIAAQVPGVDTTGLAMRITQVRAVLSADRAPAAVGSTQEDSRHTSFESGEAFNLEALIEISGLPKSQAAQIPACSVQFFSRNAVTKEKVRLGEARIADHVEGRSSFRAKLALVRLAAGNYRLEAVAMLKGQQPILAYGLAPMMQVH